MKFELHIDSLKISSESDKEPEVSVGKVECSIDGIFIDPTPFINLIDLGEILIEDAKSLSGKDFKEATK